ncbi:MAG: hypothetical protein HON65_16650 [Rhodospirillales bacterium]|nr:hypothetical protein [Rhodospirillales bacterium]
MTNQTNYYTLTEVTELIGEPATETKIKKGIRNGKGGSTFPPATRLEDGDSIFDKTDYQKWSNGLTRKCQPKQEHRKVVEWEVYDFGVCPVHGRISLKNVEIAKKEGCPKCGRRMHIQTFFVYDD